MLFSIYIYIYTLYIFIYIYASVALSVELDIIGKESLRMIGGPSYDDSPMMDLTHVSRNVTYVRCTKLKTGSHVMKLLTFPQT